MEVLHRRQLDHLPEVGLEAVDEHEGCVEVTGVFDDVLQIHDVALMQAEIASLATAA